jgi:hypothetical protein
MQGILLRTEYFGNLHIGVNNIRFLRNDLGGNQLPAGTYIFRLVNGNAEGMIKGVVL